MINASTKIATPIKNRTSTISEITNAIVIQSLRLRFSFLALMPSITKSTIEPMTRIETTPTAACSNNIIK